MVVSLMLPVLSWAGDIRFKSLTVADGLSSSVVLDIVQDRDGFMWFATDNGLNRWDGKRFKYYGQTGAASEGQSDVYVSCLLVTDSGDLLVGTRSGVDVYLPAQDKVVPYPLTRKIANEDIRTMTQLGGELLVGTNSGLYFFDIEKECFIRSFNVGNSGIPNNIVRSINYDEDFIYIGTFDGFGRLDRRTGEWRTVELMEGGPNTMLQNNLIQAIVFSPYDPDKLLAGTQTGLCEVDKHTLAFRNYDKSDGMCNTTVKSIVAVGDDVWVGSEDGLMLFDGEVFESYKYNASDLESISNNVVWAICEDDQGGIWVATDCGVNHYDSSIPSFTKLDLASIEGNPYSGLDIFDAEVDDDGVIWMVTRIGLMSYSQDSGQVRWVLSEGVEDGLYNFVKGLYIDENDLIWLGSAEGISCYDIVSDRLVDVQSELGNRLKYINSIDGDHNGKVYACAVRGGIQQVDYGFDPVGRTFTRLEDRVFETSTANNESIVVVSDDVWYSAVSDGVFRRDVATSEISVYDSFKTDGQLSYIRALHVGRYSKNVYVATDNGIYVYDPDKDGFSPLDRYLVVDSRIHTLVEDSSKNLWYTTSSYIGYVDVANSAAKRFSLSLWFDSRHSVFSSSATSGGDVYIFGIDNCLRMNASDFGQESVGNGLKLTELYINGESCERLGLVSSSLSGLESLSLSHWQNNISVSCSVLDYCDPLIITYKYKLEGYDEDWNTLDEKSDYFEYDRLPPGRYKLQVTAGNGTVSCPAYRLELPIAVRSPWWATWWAKLLYILVVLSATALVLTSINRRRRIQLELKKKEMEISNIESINKLKLSFFTNISHDLRTPLSLIIGPVESLIENESESRKTEYLTTIKNNAYRLLSLVNQILDFRKIETEKMTLNPVSGEIVSFVESKCRLFKESASQKGIELNFETSVKSLVMDFDPDKLDKIVVNLVSNAVKFTHNGGNVIVSLDRKSNDKVEVIVADSGIGISAMDLPHIFEQFYMVADSSVFSVKGSGLGLVIVKELVELHGGTISVVSKEGVGSTFVLTLPIANEVVSDSPSESVSSGLGDSDKQFSLMIVEDDAEMRKYLSSEFGELYNILAFDSAESALDAIGNFAPDMVLTDVMLPGMSGIELCSAIKENPRRNHVSVMLLTAKTNEESVMSGFESGADEYIAKPFNMKILKGRVANMLEQRRLLHENYMKSSIKLSKVEVDSPDDVFLSKVISLVEENLSEPELNVPFLCDKLSMSHVSFYRKIKALTGKNINSMVKEIRIRKAAQLLQVKGMRVTDVMYDVGFSHRSYFATCFKEMFGMTPKEYAHKYNEDNPYNEEK